MKIVRGVFEDKVFERCWGLVEEGKAEEALEEARSWRASVLQPWKKPLLEGELLDVLGRHGEAHSRLVDAVCSARRELRPFPVMALALHHLRRRDYPGGHCLLRHVAAGGSLVEEMIPVEALRVCSADETASESMSRLSLLYTSSSEYAPSLQERTALLLGAAALRTTRGEAQAPSYFAARSSDKLPFDDTPWYEYSIVWRAIAGEEGASIKAFLSRPPRPFPLLKRLNRLMEELFTTARPPEAEDWRALRRLAEELSGEGWKEEAIFARAAADALERVLEMTRRSRSPAAGLASLVGEEVSLPLLSNMISVCCLVPALSSMLLRREERERTLETFERYANLLRSSETASANPERNALHSTLLSRLAVESARDDAPEEFLARVLSTLGAMLKHASPRTLLPRVGEAESLAMLETAETHPTHALLRAVILLAPDASNEILKDANSMVLRKIPADVLHLFDEEMRKRKAKATLKLSRKIRSVMLKLRWKPRIDEVDLLLSGRRDKGELLYKTWQLGRIIGAYYRNVYSRYCGTGRLGSNPYYTIADRFKEDATSLKSACSALKLAAGRYLDSLLSRSECMCDMAFFHLVRGRKGAAGRSLDRARAEPGLRGGERILLLEGILRERWERPDEAEALYEICSFSSDMEVAAAALMNLAFLGYRRGRIESALRLMCRMNKLSQELETDRPELAAVLRLASALLCLEERDWKAALINLGYAMRHPHGLYPFTLWTAARLLEARKLYTEASNVLAELIGALEDWRHPASPMRGEPISGSCVIVEELWRRKTAITLEEVSAMLRWLDFETKTADSDLSGGTAELEELISGLPEEVSDIFTSPRREAKEPSIYNYDDEELPPVETLPSGARIHLLAPPSAPLRTRRQIWSSAERMGMIPLAGKLLEKEALKAGNAGNHSQAAVLYTEAILNTEDPERRLELLMALAHEWLEMESYEGAEECYESVLRHADPEEEPELWHGAMLQKCVVLMGEERLDEAKALLEELLERLEEREQESELINVTSFYLGICLHRLGRRDRARLMLYRAMKDEELEPWCIFRLALMEKEEGNLNRMRELTDKAERLFSSRRNVTGLHHINELLRRS